MTARFLIPLALLLAGCPTPPETSGGGNNAVPAQGKAGKAGKAGEPGKGGKAGGGEGGAGGGEGGPGGGEGGAAGAKAEGPPDGGAEGPAMEGYIRFEGEVVKEPPAAQTQEAVKAGSHVTYSGMAICSDCKGALIVRVQSFMGEKEGELAEQGNPDEVPGPITEVTLEGPGPFMIAVPKGDGAVVLELLSDEDRDGGPSTGDSMGMFEGGGTPLTAASDRDGIELDVSGRDWKSRGVSGKNPNGGGEPGQPKAGGAAGPDGAKPSGADGPAPGEPGPAGGGAAVPAPPG